MVSSPDISLSTHTLNMISVPSSWIRACDFWGMAGANPSQAASELSLGYVLKTQNFRVDTKTRISDWSFGVVALGESRRELEDSS